MQPLAEEPEREREQELLEDSLADRLPRICIFEPPSRNVTNSDRLQPLADTNNAFDDVLSDENKFHSLLDELDQLDAQDTDAALRALDPSLLDEAALYAIGNFDERDPLSFDNLCNTPPVQPSVDNTAPNPQMTTVKSAGDLSNTTLLQQSQPAQSVHQSQTQFLAQTATPTERPIIRPVHRFANSNISYTNAPQVPQTPPSSSLTLAALLNADDHVVVRGKTQQVDSPRRKSSSDCLEPPSLISLTMPSNQQSSIQNDGAIANTVRTVVRSSSSGSLQNAAAAAAVAAAAAAAADARNFKQPLTPASHGPQTHASIVQKLETQLRHTNLSGASTQSTHSVPPALSSVPTSPGSAATVLPYNQETSDSCTPLSPTEEGDESEVDEKLGSAAQTGNQQRSKRKHSQHTAPPRTAPCVVQQGSQPANAAEYPNRKTSITAETPAKRNIVLHNFE